MYIVFSAVSLALMGWCWFLSGLRPVFIAFFSWFYVGQVLSSELMKKANTFASVKKHRGTKLCFMVTTLPVRFKS
jgi:hypothetical protein